MRLLIVYVLLVVAGNFIAVQIGFYLDKVAPTFAIPIALGLFFTVLGVMCPLAVYVTERWLGSKSDETLPKLHT